MKKKLIILVITLLFFSSTVHAALILRGQGTSVHGTYNLIYDDDLDITWYDFSNAENSWANQVAWADALSVDFGGDIYNDWRLPTTVDGPPVFGYDGTTTIGFNITTSEMGYLFYIELGNLGIEDTSGVFVGNGNFGLNNTGDFQNLNNHWYWSSTEFSANTDGAWDFGFIDGEQDVGSKDFGGLFGDGMFGLAVRDGDVASPIIGFSAFTLSKTKVKFKDIPDNDKLEVKGEFVLGEGNNGIDPVNEDDVTVTVGTYSIVIAAPFSFVEETAGKFKFKGTINDAGVEMRIEETGFNTFKFEIKAKGVDLTGTCNPVDIELAVGDDEGQLTNIRLNGLLKLEVKGKDDKGSDDDDKSSDDENSDDKSSDDDTPAPPPGGGAGGGR